MSVASSFDPKKLCVVTCISNPVRFASRYALYKRFAAEMHAAGATLITVEAAFGDRPHATPELAPPSAPAYNVYAGGRDIISTIPAKSFGQHLLLQTDTEIWHKENMLNLGAARLPADFEYIAWVDADITFGRPDWHQETLEQLQHYPVVQMFETAVDEGPSGAVMGVYQGFASCHAKGMTYVPPSTSYAYGPYWHSGFAWAARREAFDAMGGLLDFAILGAADHHMALSFIGQAEQSMPGDIDPQYAKAVLAWQQRAADADIRGNIGAVPGSISHHFHGSKKNRRYIERWDILTKWGYDPVLDISRDSQGLLQLTKRGLRMRQDLRRYFSQRNEDSTEE